MGKQCTKDSTWHDLSSLSSSHNEVQCVCQWNSSSLFIIRKLLDKNLESCITIIHKYDVLLLKPQTGRKHEKKDDKRKQKRYVQHRQGFTFISRFQMFHGTENERPPCQAVLALRRRTTEGATALGSWFHLTQEASLWKQSWEFA